LDCTTEYGNGKDNRENIEDHSKEEENQEADENEERRRKRKKCIENEM
jgi:hypothetical protein